MFRISHIVLTLALVSPCFAGDLAEIRGVEAEAVSLAIQRFKAHQDYKDEQGGPVCGDLRHYSVSLRRHPHEFEIIFGPDPDKYGTI